MREETKVTKKWEKKNLSYVFPTRSEDYSDQPGEDRHDEENPYRPFA